MDAITRSNTLILAITAATSDCIENSNSLNLARKVDPKGQRTIGVLTKVDQRLHNKKDLDYLLEALRNKKLPLRMGYYAVKNR